MVVEKLRNNIKPSPHSAVESFRTHHVEKKKGPGCRKFSTGGCEGFTLAELLIIVVIIAILAGIATPIYLNQRTKAKEAKLKTEIKNYVSQILTETSDMNQSSTPQRITWSPESSTFTIGSSTFTAPENSTLQVAVRGNTSDWCIIIADEENNIMTYDKTNGLRECLPTSLISSSTWDKYPFDVPFEGTLVGPPTDFAMTFNTKVVNGKYVENSFIMGDTPHNAKGRLWRTLSEGGAQTNGGWADTSKITIERNKMYRVSVWVKKVSGNNGTFYMGTRSNTSLTLRSNGATDTNPYGIVTGISNLPLNEWVLAVAHVWPENSGIGDLQPDTGVWKKNGQQVSANKRDYIWGSANTQIFQWAFPYNSAVGTELLFYDPRIEVVDSATPTLQQLLTNSLN